MGYEIPRASAVRGPIRTDESDATGGLSLGAWQARSHVEGVDKRVPQSSCLVVMETLDSWPVAGVVIAIAFFLMFRKPIIRLVDRIKSIGPKGVVTAPLEQQVPVGPAAAELPGVFDNQLLAQIEARITELIPRSAERERTLTRYTATFGIAYLFEKIYGMIWGSQLSALQFLNSSAGGADVDDLRPFYEKSVAQTRIPNETFERWLSFLLAHLVAQQGTRVEITLKGREFLKYVIDQGHTFLKPF